MSIRLNNRRSVEVLASVMQYAENSKDISDLHNQMKECDGVLARMASTPTYNVLICFFFY